MAEHYYTPQPQSEHHERAVRAEVRGLALDFVTDAGVFSKNELDPGSRLLIESLPPLSGRVLDLGCGWGPVGVFLAKLNPEASLTLADVNERALDLARRNLDKNGVRAQLILSDGFQRIEGGFRHVVTNPPIRAGKQLIYALFDEAFRRLEPGGTLTIVIRKQQGAPSALKHFKETYGSGGIVAKDAGYWIIQTRKEENA